MSTPPEITPPIFRTRRELIDNTSLF
jgi:hypothetical protein